jgi:hypothetical protein
MSWACAADAAERINTAAGGILITLMSGLTSKETPESEAKIVPSVWRIDYWTLVPYAMPLRDGI